MIQRLLFSLALITQLLACGSEPTTDPSHAQEQVPSARYPKSMPASILDDSRLIGYWETLCQSLSQDSQRWTFLLDPSKAVLEKKVFRDDLCSEAAYTIRYYLTYSTEGEHLNGSIWEVHANIQSQDRLAGLFNLQQCNLPQVRDEIWYDLTGTGCTMNDEPSGINRGSLLIASQYSFSLNQSDLIMTLSGRTQLKFKKMD